MSSKNTYIKVRLAGTDFPVIVPITSSEKPEVTPIIQEKWQKIVDLMVRIIKVPSGLIMKLDQDTISVFISSHSPGNPYHKGDSEHLESGLYCETVTAKRVGLLVPDARTDPLWQENPDIKLGMFSYLGYPIQWPDGELFGTICVLDNKSNSYNSDLNLLIQHFRDIINDDLSLLLENTQLKKASIAHEIEKRELHHRLKNNFNVLLSSIQLELGKYKSDYKTLLSKILFSLRSLSAIHEELYSKDILNFKNVMENIIDYLLDFYSNMNLKINYSVEDINVTTKDINIYIFLLNELITNSIKHGFSQFDSPEITFSISQKDKHIVFAYKDNGTGINEKQYKKSSSLGKNLLEILPSQINGRLKHISFEESLFEFEFPA